MYTTGLELASDTNLVIPSFGLVHVDWAADANSTGEKLGIGQLQKLVMTIQPHSLVIVSESEQTIG